MKPGTMAVHDMKRRHNKVALFASGLRGCGTSEAGRLRPSSLRPVLTIICWSMWCAHLLLTIIIMLLST